ncbi:DUF2530 domain-containing protein [Xylanimonas oleitrophica]|uniref:DUF2530 domain-containing protein n=1 Tax=Xylanimonas oleitrophica TaxID=2607479 RepID=A0A2W5WRH0_9MICO|nr:DUF2530 domain-containing protein [Xylanimonas oleitrophica]PZR54109.1 DUF2530 domain-containing protein [Xylanimonas oleitrophica]
MPSIASLLAHPDRRRPSPPPYEVNLRRVVLAGIALWAVALVVALLLAVVGNRPWDGVAVCAAGIALGGLGLLWARRHR